MDEHVYEASPNRKKAVRKISDYGLEDRILMVEKVLVEKESHNDVAKEYGLKAANISWLVSKIKKDKQYMTKLLDAKQDELRKRKIIAESAQVFIQESSYLKSASQLRNFILDTNQIKVTDRLLCSVLREDLSLSYRKI